jgi:hypothetical protein
MSVYGLGECCVLVHGLLVLCIAFGLWCVTFDFSYTVTGVFYRNMIWTDIRDPSAMAAPFQVPLTNINAQSQGKLT